MVLNSLKVRTRFIKVRLRVVIYINKLITYLPNHGAFKDNEHKEGKKTVVPIFVQTPEGNTKDLEHEKRSGCVLREQFSEGGNGDVKFVVPVQPLQYRNL